MRCETCVQMQCIDTTCDNCRLARKLIAEGDTTIPAIEFGEESRVELWTEADEKRMDVIGSNGNDGEAYK